MKKFLVLAALALTAFAATDASAMARTKVTENLPWSTTSGTFTFAQDAISAPFSLRNASMRMFGSGDGGWNVVDSLLIGYLVVYQDSTIDIAATVTAATVTLQASGDGNDWANVGTATISATSDDPVLVFPLWFVGADHQNLLTTAPLIRANFTAVTGSMAAARMNLVWWLDRDVYKVEETVPWLATNGFANGWYETISSTKPLASATLDTTGVFSLFNANIDMPGAFSSMDWNDSVLVGFLVAYTDTVGDVASTLTAATLTIDGSWNGRDWVTLGTVAGVAASDDPVVTFPLGQRLQGSIGVADQTYAHLTNVPVLRARFTAATGYLLACRLKLQYWKVPS